MKNWIFALLIMAVATVATFLAIWAFVFFPAAYYVLLFVVIFVSGAVACKKALD